MQFNKSNRIQREFDHEKQSVGLLLDYKNNFAYNKQPAKEKKNENELLIIVGICLLISYILNLITI